MAKTTKHIVSIGYRKFACDSITTASQLVALLSKCTPAEYCYETGKSWFQPLPDDGRHEEITLEANRPWHDPNAKRPKGPKGLPSPARGSILCICEQSWLAPRQNCPSCGRPYYESAHRTH